MNGSIVNKPGYRLKVEDIVSVSNPKLLYKQLEDRLKNDLVLSNYPAYLEVNYKLGTVIFCQFPTNEQIPYPFFMDIENLTNSFSK